MAERRRRGGGRRGAQRSVSLDAEDAEFAEAMATLDASGGWPVLSDKALADKKEPPSAETVAKKKREIARLDLHNFSIEDALVRLESFLVEAAARGRRRALVITGRGRRSPGGVPVLRRVVNGWLQREGAPWVSAVETAPKELGGDGAWLVYLHRPRPR
ncbi:MAG: Smr/MutS family protein [Acidobacteriota bacterium]